MDKSMHTLPHYRVNRYTSEYMPLSYQRGHSPMDHAGRLLTFAHHFDREA